MSESRDGMIVSGEVIPPQTYLHKVAAAKRDEAADDDAHENTATTPEDTTDDTAAVGEDTYSAADAGEEDEFPPHTIAMPAASADTTTRDGVLETDAAARATATTGEAHPGSHADAADTAVMDAPVTEVTRPDAAAPEVPAAAEPREARPGDVPIPEDVSLIGDGADIREQWMRVQASFVDDPRAAVSAAAGVITDAAARVETAVRQRQQALRDKLDSEGADTEALRVTMQQYRQLLERLAAL